MTIVEVLLPGMDKENSLSLFILINLPCLSDDPQLTLYPFPENLLSTCITMYHWICSFSTNICQTMLLDPTSLLTQIMPLVLFIFYQSCSIFIQTSCIQA